MMKPLLAVALIAQSFATFDVAQAQNTQPADVHITRAVYGATRGSADVTAAVTLLARPGLDEFYATPRWLGVDPAVGVMKDLVIFYEYRGEPHVLTMQELGAVSHTILVERADPATRRRPIAAGADTGVVILRAYYGEGREFQEVTNLTRQAIRQAGDPIFIGATMMRQSPSPDDNLIITYSYQGIRNTWSAWSGARISYGALAAYAKSEGQAHRYSDAPPAWLQSAQPSPPGARGTAGPGSGPAPRREAGIFELVKAVAELEAIAANERSPAVTSALTSTKKALADAQENIGYPYPPASSPPPQAQGSSTADHLSNTVRSLRAALDQLNAANAGRGRGAAASMTQCKAEINESLATLR